MKPPALVRTVVPPIVVVFRPAPVLVAAGAGELAPATATPSSTSAATASAVAVIAAARAARRGDPGREPGRSRCRAAGRGLGRGVRRDRSQRERGQDRECGHLDHAGGDARGGADLFEPEQPDPDRQQIAAQGGQREGGSPRGRQPGRRGQAGRRWPARPARGRRRRSPAAGTASRSSGSSGSRSGTGPGGSPRRRSAGRPRYPQHDGPPAGSRWFRVLLSGSRCRDHRLPGRGFPPYHRVRPVVMLAGLGWGAARVSTRSRRSRTRNCLRARVLRCRSW